MRRFKCALLAAVAAIGFASFASAADMPVKARLMAPAVYDWTGFYVGINGGGGWGRSRFDFDSFRITTGNYNTSGGLVGGTIGYNWQVGTWVLGLEGDLDWTNINGSGLAPTPTFTARTSNSWLATARGRLGYAANNWLLYGTGGAAWGNVKAEYSVNPAAPLFPGQTSTRSGWAAGGGIEYGVTRNVSVKAEYLYIDLGTASCTRPNCSSLTNVSVPFSVSTARLGLNYRF